MEEGLLKVGDLVEPFAPAFQDFYDYYYSSPGLLMKVEEFHTSGDHYRQSYKIRWNDGRITNEHTCFIRKVTT